MWHSSVASGNVRYGRDTLEAQARRELDGVGDAALGEWVEWGGTAVHVRRRLSAAEQRRVGPVVDIRRTAEARRRAARVGDRLRFVLPDVLIDELGAPDEWQPPLSHLDTPPTGDTSVPKTVSGWV